jgi:hypothetical protein
VGVDLPEKALARLATSEVPSEMLALRGETATDGTSSVRPPNKNRLRNSCFCRVAGGNVSSKRKPVECER